MQSLALIRRILEIIGLCLKDSHNRTYGRVTNYVISLLLTGFLMITFEYILTHFDDRANGLYAVMQFITFFTVWTCYISFANQKQFTFDFVTKLQEIVENFRKCLNTTNSKTFFLGIYFFFGGDRSKAWNIWIVRGR